MDHTSKSRCWPIMHEGSTHIPTHEKSRAKRNVAGSRGHIGNLDQVSGYMIRMPKSGAKSC